MTIGLEDLAGNPLAQAYTASFTLADQESLALGTTPDPRRTARSTIGNQAGFQGLPVDEETGLIYVRNRYYDPELGRFITADPKGYMDGPSPYTFVRNDPVNKRDPQGTDAVWITGPDGATTLLIPVKFVGADATPANVAAIS